MQLTRTAKQQLETDKNFLKSMLNRHGKVDANVVLEEETGEELITLLMSNTDIQKAIKKAVEEFFGTNYLASDFHICCGKRLIIFTISKKC